MQILNTLRTLLIIVCFAFTLPTWSMQILKVKNKNALIDLQGSDTKVGDLYYALDSNGKKKAIIKITKVSGQKAIASIEKGKAEPGMNLEHRTKKAKAQPKTQPEQQAQPKEQASSEDDQQAYWGMLFGFSMDSMDVDLDSPINQTVNLTGNAFSGKLLFDYQLFDIIWFRGTSGIEGFSGDGPAKCGAANNSVCDVDIYYLSFDFWGRVVFGKKEFRPWAGGGFSLLFPMKKQATALEEASITNTSALSVGAGFDWFVSPRFFIPMSVEYSFLPESDQVSASFIAIRAGFGIPF